MGSSFKDKQSRIYFWWGVAFSAGMMASPDTFVRTGKFLGQSGFLGLFLIILFAVFYILILKTGSDQFSTNFQNHSDFAAIFAFLIKFIALNFIATSLLVTSGFVFNEVFLYWFPNFGFAFILLGVLLGIQFLPQRTIRFIQIILVFIPVTILIILSIAGFLNAPAQNYISEYWALDGVDIKHTSFFLTPLLFFIGFDLGLNLFPQKDETGQIFSHHGALSAILIFAVLFSLWGFIYMYFLPKEKLFTTTIPHIITAKEILGTSGRYLMGLMIISGSMAALNATFFYLSRCFAYQKGQTKADHKHGKLTIIISSMIIGIMMAAGIAGDDKIDVYVKAVLILWLISYGVSLLSCSSNKISNQNFSNRSVKNKNKLLGLLLRISILILIVTDENFNLLIYFLFPALIIIFIVSFVVLLANKHKRNF